MEEVHCPLPEVSNLATLDGDASHHSRRLGRGRERDISSGLAELEHLWNIKMQRWGSEGSAACREG